MHRVFITMASRQKQQLMDARSAVGALIGAEPAEIIFTSGGTEADNFAIRGVAEALEVTGRKHLITCGIEHEAVLNTFKALAKRGWKTTVLPLDASGILSPDRLREAITDDTALVSVMHANNEIGTIQPIAELAAIAHGRGALFHTDAVQSTGKIPVSVRALGVDLLAMSAHKFYGPKGVGGLWVKRGVRLSPFVNGGKQERNRRAGTENVPGIIGMGVAAQRAMQKMDSGCRAPLGPARPAGGRDSLGGAQYRSQRRPRRAGAEHDQYQLRSHRSRVAVNRARSRRRRRLDGIGVLLRYARAVTRPQSDEPVEPSGTELDPFQPGREQHRGTDRSRHLDPAADCDETAQFVSGGISNLERRTQNEEPGTRNLEP